MRAIEWSLKGDDLSVGPGEMAKASKDGVKKQTPCLKCVHPYKPRHASGFKHACKVEAMKDKKRKARAGRRDMPSLPWPKQRLALTGRLSITPKALTAA